MSKVIETFLPWQQRLLDQVSKGLAEIDTGGNSVGILLSGPSGTGKTALLDELSGAYPPYVEGIQRCFPCCRVSALAKSETTSVSQSILVQLGWSLAAASTIRGPELEMNVHRALNRCRVRILILEELNNALTLESKLLRGQLARFLKNLWNLHPPDDPQSWAHPQKDRADRRLIIIVSGTEDIRSAFDAKVDAELSSRFSCRVNAMKLWFDAPESRSQFRTVFTTISSRWGLIGLVDPSDPGVLSRSLFACQGHLRELDSLLRRAATLHKRGGTAYPENAPLAEAFDEVIRRDSSQGNPFLWSEGELRERLAAVTGPRGGR